MDVIGGSVNDLTDGEKVKSLRLPLTLGMWVNLRSANRV